MEDCEYRLLDDILCNINYCEKDKNKLFFTSDNLSEVLERRISSFGAEMIEEAWNRSKYNPVDDQ